MSQEISAHADGGPHSPSVQTWKETQNKKLI